MLRVVLYRNRIGTMNFFHCLKKFKIIVWPILSCIILTRMAENGFKELFEIPAPGTTILFKRFKPIARTDKTSRFRVAFISSIAIQLKKT